MNEIRNRIIEYTLKSGRDFLDHNDNPRVHPMLQRGGIRGSVNETGVTDVLRAYYSERNGGKLTLLDGHARRSEFPDLMWPVLILDIDDAEADKQILIEDGLGSMAEYDPVRVGELSARANIQNAELRAAADKLRDRLAPQLEAIRRMAEERRTNPPEQSPVAQNFAAHGNTAMRLVVMVEDVGTVERALAATGIPNRAQALLILCQHYLGSKP